MLLPIERWFVDNSLPQEARIALEESVRCFKAGAYRAGLLFSYLGWSLTLRARILSAQCPKWMPPGQWNQILLDLRNEDKWDAQVFDCTQMKAPKDIFNVSDDLRLQVKYWKDRRNDCAHFKNNEISSAHVEAFWLFVQSNLGKFVPNGSAADILDRIARHFDPNITPPGTNIAPVVAMIPSGVALTDLPQFLADVVVRLTVTWGIIVSRREPEIASVFEAIFALGNNAIISSLVAFISSDKNLLVSFLRRYPNRVLYWGANAPLIRQLWRSDLFEGGAQDLHVYAALVRNGLIPVAEILEANTWVAKRLNNDIPYIYDLQSLESCGFISALQALAFVDGEVNDFGWGNRNATMIQWLVQRYPITDEIAQVLCSVFSGPPYPYGARDSLKALFANDANKKAEFIAAAGRLGRTPPTTLV